MTGKSSTARKAPAKTRAPSAAQVAKRLKESEQATGERLDALEQGLGDLQANVDAKMDSILAAVQGIQAPAPETANPGEPEVHENVAAQAYADAAQGMDPAHRPTQRDYGHFEADEPAHQEGTTRFNGANERETDVVVVTNGLPPRPGFESKEDYELFMNQTVTVAIHEVSDEWAEQMFSVEMHPKKIWFQRGKSRKCPRWAVELLARARPVGFRNVEQTNDLGEKEVIYPWRSGLRYPFAVIEDPDPRGRGWLENILHEERTSGVIR